jgi:hypothetical protein
MEVGKEWGRRASRLHKGPEDTHNLARNKGRTIGRSRSENKARVRRAILPAQTPVVSHSFESPSMSKILTKCGCAAS